MMLEKILRTLRSEPLALTAPAFASITSLFEGRLANGEFSRDGTDMCGGQVLQYRRYRGGLYCMQRELY